jgi:hypothetical protein
MGSRLRLEKEVRDIHLGEGTIEGENASAERRVGETLDREKLAIR